MLKKLLNRNKKQIKIAFSHRGKTTAAIELISLDGNLPSIFNQIELLQKPTDILHLYLDNLLKFLKKMETSGYSYYNGHTIN